jgi:hypothetical protein
MDPSEKNKSEYRPVLNTKITITDFKKHYWLKEELQNFCRKNDITATGSKIELSMRIEHLLSTGEKKIEVKKNRRKYSSHMKDSEELSVNTVITKEYTNNEKNRKFFKSVIGPQFHFTTRFMNFCKNNSGKTYQDAIDEWYVEQKEKKEGKFKIEIAPQFEYNKFIQDFYIKPENKGKKLKDAIEAWQKSKRERGR